MKNIEARDIETTLRQPVDLDLSLNDLRIIVGCIGAVSYMAEADDEPYLDPDGKRLMERLQGLYHDNIQNKTLLMRDAPRLSMS